MVDLLASVSVERDMTLKRRFRSASVSQVPKLDYFVKPSFRKFDGDSLKNRSKFGIKRGR
jgi:hypothetical protein